IQRRQKRIVMSIDSGKWAGPRSAIAEIVLEQVRSALTDEYSGQLDLNSPLRELGLDSLATMEAVNRIEAEFGVRFTEESLYDIECCRDLVACVEERLAFDSAPVAPVDRVAEPATKSHSRAELAAAADVTQFAECQAFSQR